MAFLYYLQHILRSKESLHLDAPVIVIALAKRRNLEENHTMAHHLLKGSQALIPLCWNENFDSEGKFENGRD